MKLIREDWGFPDSEVVAEMKFDIPKSYNFHKAKTKDVEVDLIRIFVGGNNNVDADRNKDPDEPVPNAIIDDKNNVQEQLQPTDDGKTDGEDVGNFS